MSRVLASTLPLLAATLVALALSEGYSSEPYKDQVGVVTVGFGHAHDAAAARPTTPVRALVTLAADADATRRLIAACLHEPVAPHEFDAFLRLAYNIGPTRFCRSSVAKAVNRRDYQAACDAILLYVYAGGKRNQGLANVRAEQHATCKNTKNRPTPKHTQGHTP